MNGRKGLLSTPAYTIVRQRNWQTSLCFVPNIGSHFPCNNSAAIIPLDCPREKDYCRAVPLRQSFVLIVCESGRPPGGLRIEG
jgi:hypothetical protein